MASLRWLPALLLLACHDAGPGSADTSGGEAACWALGAWSEQGRLDEARVMHAMVAVGDVAIVLGGAHGVEDNRSSVEYARLDSDGALDPWRHGPALPQAIDQAAAAFLHDRIWLFGGKDEGYAHLDAVYAVDFYDGAFQGEWERVGALPEARSGHGAVVVDGVVYLTEGVGERVLYSDLGDPDEWRYGEETGQCVYCNGAPFDGGIASLGEDHILFTPLIDGIPQTREDIGTTQEPLSHRAATALQGDLLYSGGASLSSLRGEVWSARLGSDGAFAFTPWPDLPDVRWGHQMRRVGSQVLVTGGSSVGPETGSGSTATWAAAVLPCD